ncbi:MAG: chloride channel protein [Candidatus Methylomirabilales bacterium]|nr:chloride channel protein [candidate division NC10 bacterium]
MAEEKEEQGASPGYLRRILLRLAYHPRIPEGAYLTVVSILVGLATGVGSVIFIKLLQYTTHFFFETGRGALTLLGEYYVILLPAIGGLIVGPLIYRFAQEAKGHGVPEVMTAMAVKGGRIRKRVAFAKIVTSALTIGSGGSAGREGPMIQIGAGIGSTVGQYLKMSDERIKTLVACGAAGGIAATFNAPIAGAMFALEIFMGQVSLDFSLVILSSVSSAIVSRAMLGDFPSFTVPAYGLLSAKEMPLYLLLGVLAGLAAVAFVRVLYWFEDRFDSWRFPAYLMPAVGGLLVGVMGFFLPQIFGTGFPAIEEALNGRTSLALLAILIFAKMLATPLTLASGGSGGVFAPALFVGAMLGGAYGHIVHGLFPSFTAGAGAYALVGMGAVFGGAAQAPITAIIIIFEMTGDYRIILPIMTSTVISVLIYNVLNKETIYTLKLVKRGIRFRAGRDVDVMASIPVREALTDRLLWLPEEVTVEGFLQRSAEEQHEWFPVLNQSGELTGVVTAQDVQKALDNGDLQAKVGELATKDLITVTPDNSLHDVLVRFHVRDLGHLPVVDPDNPKKLVGIISRSHVIRAYNQALISKHLL